MSDGDYSIMNKISFERFIGRRIIEINGKCPILSFDEGAFLTIECQWRLRNDSSILLGCSEYDSEATHKDAHNKLLTLLTGKEIIMIRYFPPVSDLCIEFEGTLFLELFSDSSIYESWTLSDGKNYNLISLPGGDYCLFDK